ncbi:hypothetical protein HAX54_049476, partial [Datura stramonium]|nr:hypothetical protein [Datura stramonium]
IVVDIGLFIERDLIDQGRIVKIKRVEEELLGIVSIVVPREIGVTAWLKAHHGPNGY